MTSTRTNTKVKVGSHSARRAAGHLQRHPGGSVRHGHSCRSSTGHLRDCPVSDSQLQCGRQTEPPQRYGHTSLLRPLLVEVTMKLCYTLYSK